MMYEAEVSQHLLYKKQNKLTLIMCLKPNLPPPQFHSSFFSMSANVIIDPECPEYPTL